MESCPRCKNFNIKNEEDYKWCRNCGWTSDGKAPPLTTSNPRRSN